MLNRTALILFAALAGTAAAQDITPTSSSRDVNIYQFLYDSFWRESSSKNTNANSTDTEGAFEEDLIEDFNTLFQLTQGRALQESDVWFGGIVNFTELEARAVDYDIGEATVSSTSDQTTTFQVTSPVRISITASMDTDTDFGTPTSELDASASVTLTGPSGTLFEVSSSAPEVAYGEAKLWLQPGTYTLTVHGEANVTADQYTNPQDPYAEWQQATVELGATLHSFCPADFDANGVVDQADKDAFMVEWNARTPEADFDGNGRVNNRDRRRFNRAFNGGC